MNQCCLIVKNRNFNLLYNSNEYNSNANFKYWWEDKKEWNNTLIYFVYIIKVSPLKDSFVQFDPKVHEIIGTKNKARQFSPINRVIFDDEYIAIKKQARHNIEVTFNEPKNIVDSNINIAITIIYNY